MQPVTPNTIVHERENHHDTIHDALKDTSRSGKPPDALIDAVGIMQRFIRHDNQTWRSTNRCDEKNRKANGRIELDGSEALDPAEACKHTRNRQDSNQDINGLLCIYMFNKFTQS
jgi:hypothetical protein